MSDETNEHPETEARLRAALSARAASVQPSAGDPASAFAAGASARRRRTSLAAAAVVLLVAAIAGAALLLGGNDEEDVATGPDSTTTATSAPVDGSGDPVIWPLPTMSLQYSDPSTAAQAFMSGYVGVPASCGSDPDTDGTRLDMHCGPEAACTTTQECIAATDVTVEQRGLGWVVLGAESLTFDVVTPQAGDTVGASIEVVTTGLDEDRLHVAELRPLGEPLGSAPNVGNEEVGLSEDGSWHLILGAADGQVVVIVQEDLGVTARVITVDSVGVPLETTTTTTGPTDDGTQGWPGTTSRHFDDPQTAVTAFATEVLGFADPTVGTGTGLGPAEGPDVVTEWPVTPRPSSTLVTLITVHDTGTARGWVVVGVSSDQGTIDSVTRHGDDVILSGNASAFEAQINVRLYDVDGNVLGETSTFAGANGEIGPYQAAVHQDVAADGPVFVQIAEGDASGEGDWVWATWAEVPA